MFEILGHFTVALDKKSIQIILFFLFLQNVVIKAFELVHNKTYNKTCVTSIDSDQPLYPPSMARTLVNSSLSSLESVEGTCDQ